MWPPGVRHPDIARAETARNACKSKGGNKTRVRFPPPPLLVVGERGNDTRCCIFSGPGAGLTRAQIIQTIVSDAAAYNTDKTNVGYGFQGDPLRPISGGYYGYPIWAEPY